MPDLKNKDVDSFESYIWDGIVPSSPSSTRQLTTTIMAGTAFERVRNEPLVDAHCHILPGLDDGPGNSVVKIVSTIRHECKNHQYIQT